MKIKILFIIICIFINNLIVAKNTETLKKARNFVFFEVGGSGGYGSINYEYLVKKIKKLKLSVRVGASSYHLNDYTNKFNPDVIIPITINAYYGTKHNIYFGLGQAITSIVYANNSDYKPKRTNNSNTNLSIGYRYQKEVGGIMFKIGYASIIENNNMFRHWFLLAFGYTF